MSDELKTLREFHEAVIADLQAAYAGRVETVAAYDPFPDRDGQERKPIVTPALLLAIESIGPSVSDGTERRSQLLSCTLHCILSLRTSDVQLELREFASDVLGHIEFQQWGLAAAVQVPEGLSAAPGEFSPGVAGFDSWQVTWEQQVYIGASAWGGGVAPSVVWLGGELVAGDPTLPVDEEAAP